MARASAKLLYPIEAAGAWLAYGALRALPLDVAAGLGAWILRLVGPLLPVHRLALANLRAALPDLPAGEHAAIARRMWDNLGRTLGEFAHLDHLLAEYDRRVTIENIECLAPFLRDGGPGVFVSGHLANWEILNLTFTRLGMPLDLVYRAPNNPLVAPLFDRRRLDPRRRAIPKGPEGARMVLRSVREGRFVGLLIDQRMSDGIEARLFGRPAMTTSAPARLALRAGCPLVAMRVERTGASRFKVTALPPIEMPAGEDQHRVIAATTQRLNDLLEGWIRDRPEQWLWVHRRWRTPPPA